MMYPDVVVFAGGAIGSPISICRNIKLKYEVDTFILCINSSYLKPIFEKSKYVTKVISFDDIDSSSKLLEVIETWYQKMNFQQKPIVFSTTDISCIYISDYRDKYGNMFILTYPSTDIIKTYSSKGNAEIAALRHGIKVPQGMVVKKENDVDKIVKSFHFPVILKPISTREEYILGFKVKIVDYEHFQSCCNLLLETSHHFLCQEYIPGDDNSVWFYLFVRLQDGQVFDLAGIKTLQSPPGNGIMAIGESKNNIELKTICRNFLCEIDFKGIGGLEFKYYNGNYYFIEMNVRTEAIVPIADSTLPFSLIIYEDIIGTLNTKNYPIIDKDIKYIDLRALFFARLIEKRYIQLLRDIFSNLFRSTVRYNIYYKDDKKPFFYTIFMSLLHGFKRILHK